MDYDFIFGRVPFIVGRLCTPGLTEKRQSLKYTKVIKKRFLLIKVSMGDVASSLFRLIELVIIVAAIAVLLAFYKKRKEET